MDFVKPGAKTKLFPVTSPHGIGSKSKSLLQRYRRLFHVFSRCCNSPVVSYKYSWFRAEELGQSQAIFLLSISWKQNCDAWFLQQT